MQQIVEPATYEAIRHLGDVHYATPMTIALLGLWTAGTPKRVKELEKKGELLPLFKCLMSQLEKAQEMTGTHPHLATHEIMLEAGIPLRLGT